MLPAGIALILAAVVFVLFGVSRPSAPRLPLERRRPAGTTTNTGLSKATGVTSEVITTRLERLGWSQPLAAALERAGLKSEPAEFLILAGSVTLVALLFGFLLGGPALGLLFALAGPIGTKMMLSLKAGARRRAFADQLDDTLQLLSGGLRAGHSLLRAIDAVSREAESPTAEEFARIVNETRLGRDLNTSLEQCAERMRCEDFSWVAQAIGIHREVGGDLATVLDEVGHTIRERNQIRRQVAGLSAEGKMSAYILFALPFAVSGILVITSPAYVTKFVQSPIGFIMLGAAVIMLTIGGLWMKKVVSFKF